MPGRKLELQDDGLVRALAQVPGRGLVARLESFDHLVELGHGADALASKAGQDVARLQASAFSDRLRANLANIDALGASRDLLGQLRVLAQVILGVCRQDAEWRPLRARVLGGN